ncbi:fimbrial protein [Vibrio furnissii]|uniref:fimbrial protein n=1 Tax=Vibrio furnissii TaxID=29494 RepID=UPI000E08B79C|nr:fimbrial protein [Vibrio furnissii]QDC94805.1 type 1 fimbrial protein [Vibrio furnissii]UON50242.1 fimbrial protein [Vibrio furnissii]SUQ32487.1 fimbrial protein [Vibrio furnissii]
MTHTKLLILPAIISVFLSTTAVADPSAGTGTITFSGAIIDAPCYIAPGSDEQTISLGQVNKSLLASGGETADVPFSIKLDGCDLDTIKNVTVTFKGEPADTSKKSLAINGTASGAAVALMEFEGDRITLGQPTNNINLVDGSNELKFKAKMTGVQIPNGEGVELAPINVGNFTAVTDFILEYN